MYLSWQICVRLCVGGGWVGAEAISFCSVWQSISEHFLFLHLHHSPTPSLQRSVHPLNPNTHPVSLRCPLVTVPFSIFPSLTHARSFSYQIPLFSVAESGDLRYELSLDWVFYWRIIDGGQRDAAHSRGVWINSLPIQ